MVLRSQCESAAMAWLAKSRGVEVLVKVHSYGVGMNCKILQLFQCLGPCLATKQSCKPNSSFWSCLGDPDVVHPGCDLDVYEVLSHEFPT